MATLEVAFSLFCSYPTSSPNFRLCPKRLPFSKLRIAASSHPLSLKYPPCPLRRLSVSKFRNLSCQVLSEVQEVQVEEKSEETQEPNQRRKLFVLNLPWSFTVTDVKNLFGECGTVTDVEIIKQKDGKNRGFAFVTMSSGEEAQAVVDKFDSHEISGRNIRVEFAKKFKKPSPPRPPTSPPPGETRHKLYISNLAWKTRASHLREVFAANFNPVSVRVVFDGASGRSAGYGFVSFPTKDEAESAISALDGKEVLGRPLRLALSQGNTDESGNEKNEEDKSMEPTNTDESENEKNEEDISKEQLEQS